MENSLFQTLYEPGLVRAQVQAEPVLVRLQEEHLQSPEQTAGVLEQVQGEAGQVWVWGLRKQRSLL